MSRRANTERRSKLHATKDKEPLTNGVSDMLYDVMMIKYILSLMVWISERATPSGGGLHNEEKQQDMNAETSRNYETAYFRYMYLVPVA